jgi:cellulose synthase/poly-beta-1,6-N-acetylglucosamine synthase-like glycosyltransferase
LEIAFWLLAASIAWCYAGYPLFIAGLARFRPRPVRRGDASWRPTVTVVVAVRNGQHLLEQRVRNLLDQQYPAERLGIVIVCNGSDDATLAVARKLASAHPRVQALTSPALQGKAGAINRARESARGDIIVFADARQTFAPDAVMRLVEPLADTRVGVVTGRLLVARADTASVEGVRLYWGMESRLRNAESRSGSVVGATGAIYAVRAVLLPDIPANLILDDVYVPMRIALAGYRVVMAPEALAYDVPATDQRAEFDRKRRTMVGNIQLVRSLPALLSPRANPLFVRFFSHKVLRLLTPFSAIAMVLLSAALDGLLYKAFLVGSLAVYLLGALGLVSSIPVLSVPSAFVLLHGAIFAAIWRWRDDASRVWTGAGGERVHGSAGETAPAVTSGDSIGGRDQQLTGAANHG